MASGASADFHVIMISYFVRLEVRGCDVDNFCPNECNLVEAHFHIQESETNAGSYRARPLYGLSSVWTWLICWEDGAAAQHSGLQSCEGCTFCSPRSFERRWPLKWVTAADTMEPTEKVGC